MNDEKKRLARADGIVAVEHRVETTYSDERAPYAFLRSHNITAAPGCSLCRDVRRNMERLAVASP